MVNLLSFLKKNLVKILVVVLVVAVLISSVALYFVHCDYYYERNMSRYAM